MGSDLGSEPLPEEKVPEMELVDVSSIKEEIENSETDVKPLEAENYEPSVLYTFAENGGNVIGNIANGIVTVCSEFIDILF